MQAMVLKEQPSNGWTSPTGSRGRARPADPTRCRRSRAAVGDGQHCRDGAQAFAGIALEAARHVDRNDRQSPAGFGSQSFRSRSLERTAEAGSKNGIDHQLGPVEHRRRQQFDGAAPVLRMVPGFTCKMIALAEQGDADRPARFGKPSSRHEAVAAVVAGSAQQGNERRRPGRWISRATALPAFSISRWPACPQRSRDDPLPKFIMRRAPLLKTPTRQKSQGCRALTHERSRGGGRQQEQPAGADRAGL